MREPNYRQALSHSWEIIKEHKILWIFGLLSVCLGQWGLANFLGGLNLAGLQNFAPGAKIFFAGKILMILGGQGVTPTLLVIWLALIGAGIFILALFVAVVARGALIAAVGHWFAKDGKVSLSVVWSHGVKNFWKILFLTILARALEAVLLLFALAAFSLFDNTAAGFVGQAFYGALTLAGGLIIEAVIIFASGYVVIDGASVPSAVARGWRLFTRHVLVTLELGILLVVLSLVAAIVVAVAAFLVFIPAFLIWALALLIDSSVLLALGAVTASGLFLLSLAFVAGIFNAFNTSAWMYLFVKMHRESYVGWLLHKIKKLFVR